MTLLRECVPELAGVVPDPCTKILVVGPAKDPLSAVALECAGVVFGALHEAVAFGGPAYRTIPKSPVVSYQLIRIGETKTLPTPEDG